jgi:hypothetical protein
LKAKAAKRNLKEAEGRSKNMTLVKIEKRSFNAIVQGDRKRVIVPGQPLYSFGKPAVSRINERAAKHGPSIFQANRFAHQVASAALDQSNRWRILAWLERAIDVDHADLCVFRAYTVVRAVAK